MSVETDLRAWLLGDPAIVAIVGTRIYPGYIPATGSVPALVYQRIVTEREYAHDGQAEYFLPRIQYSAWASTQGQAFDLAMAVVDRLRDYVDQVTVVNEIHDGQPKEQSGAPTDRYRVLLDVAVYATETV